MWKLLQGPTGKVLGVGFLALLMLIPLLHVQWLVAERKGLREEAVANIAQGWGGRQVLGGLVLWVPTTRTVVVKDGDAEREQARTSADVILADALSASATLDVQTRRFGIYGAPVYAATVELHGQFLPSDLADAQRASNGSWQPEKAELRLLVQDLHGLQQVDELTVDGKPVRFTSSTDRIGGLSTVAIPVNVQAWGNQPVPFTVRLRLAGTESLQWLPLARATSVEVAAPWGDPSFVGGTLPAERKVEPTQFSARWKMLDINRSYGQYWSGDGNPVREALTASAFGVQLYQPVDVYQRNERAGKYGILFVALTFVAFFLFEVLKQLRVHPVQYLMVGAALATFYVLLLALSEQIGFGAAYLVAATAVVLMVGGYASSVLRTRRAGMVLGAVMGLVYAVLYGLVAAEQYALLMGAVVIVLVVALLMYLTRKVDWYALAALPESQRAPARAGNMEGL